LLIWKVFGRRTDGWANDDFPTETVPGDPKTLRVKGKPVPNTAANRNRADLDFIGSIMPPVDAVAGTAVGPGSKRIKVAPLSDEDRLTLVRWIDLGCPIDLDHDPARPEINGFGWLLDDQRPTLTMTCPRPGTNPPLSRMLVGMYDYEGLNQDSFQVVANFAVDDVPAGQNLANQFASLTQGVWELRFKEPIRVRHGRLMVSVKDRQGNETRIERTFSSDTEASR
jgi:hypothetical protein